MQQFVSISFVFLVGSVATLVAAPPTLISIGTCGPSFPTTVSNAMVRMKSAAGRLRLDTKEGAFAPGNGSLIVPGDPAKSVLFSGCSRGEGPRCLLPCRTASLPLSRSM